jgi:hypothetical protein
MVWKIFLLAIPLRSLAFAQPAPPKSPLLDHPAGHWVLQGTIAGQQATHDVDGDWTLDHHYLRIHEVSRDQNSQAKPSHEAFVFFIGWNEQPNPHVCAGLDVFGGLRVESIGVATAKESAFPFVFKDEKGSTSVTNDFLYHSASDTWEWQIDNIDKGTPQPFAGGQLTRAER